MISLHLFLNNDMMLGGLEYHMSGSESVCVCVQAYAVSARACLYVNMCVSVCARVRTV